MKSFATLSSYVIKLFLSVPIFPKKYDCEKNGLALFYLILDLLSIMYCFIFPGQLGD